MKANRVKIGKTYIILMENPDAPTIRGVAVERVIGNGIRFSIGDQKNPVCHIIVSGARIAEIK